MSIYMILLKRPSEEAWAAISEHWPDHLLFDDQMAFISAENEVSTKVAERIGIGMEGIRGMVMRTDYFAGTAHSAIVEWVSKQRD